MTDYLKQISALVEKAAEAEEGAEAMKYAQAALSIWQIQYNFSFPRKTEE